MRECRESIPQPLYRQAISDRKLPVAPYLAPTVVRAAAHCGTAILGCAPSCRLRPFPGLDFPLPDFETIVCFRRVTTVTVPQPSPAYHGSVAPCARSSELASSVTAGWV